MPGIRKTFAKNPKALRKARKMSQEQLAERLDISVRYIQQLEGKHTPNVKLDTIANIARALKVSALEFLK